MEEQNFAEIIEPIKEFILQYAWPYGLVLLAIPLIFIIVSLVSKAIKRGKARDCAPQLDFLSFQVAPMGKDAWLKLKNNGHEATIEKVYIPGRRDIKISNAHINFKLERNAVYGIFCESTTAARLDSGFEIIVGFKDKLGNSYDHTFYIDNKHHETKGAKLVSYA